MKRNLLLVIAICTLTFSSMAQSIGEETYKTILACQCREIVMISNKIEKPYTATWLEGIEFENGSIIFSKGETRHFWNAEKIVFVEKNSTSIRVYLE